MTFKESMAKCNCPVDPSDKQWEVLEKAYDTWYLNYTGPKEPKIPKILHQVWIGGRPFPKQYQVLTDHWKKMHPDWHYMLWTEKEIEEFGLVNKEMYDNMVNPAAKSDVTRFEVVYSYGGVYIDTDLLCCKPLDDLLYLDFFTGNIGYYTGKSAPAQTSPVMGIIAGAQGNKILSSIIQKISKAEIVPRTVPEIMTITGPEMYAAKVNEGIANNPMSVAFPVSYFYPFPAALRELIRTMTFEDMQSILSDKFRYPETYAIHLWYSSWQTL